MIHCQRNKVLFRNMSDFSKEMILIQEERREIPGKNITEFKRDWLLNNMFMCLLWLEEWWLKRGYEDIA